MPHSNMRNVCTLDHKCYLLAVDDSEEILELIEGLFDDTNIEVLTASTLKGALEKIAETENLELVLLDFGLPDSDGLHTLRAVREACAGRIAIIGMTGSLDLEDAAYANGVVDFFGKPLLQIDVIGRSKGAIINQRRLNLANDLGERYRAMCESLEAQLEGIMTTTSDNRAIEGLSLVLGELRQDATAFLPPGVGFH